MTLSAALEREALRGPGVATSNDPEVSAHVQPVGGSYRLHLMVEGIHCGGCVRRIDRALQADPAVTEARVNLTTRRLAVSWRGPAALGSHLVGIVQGLGFQAVPYDPDALASGDAADEKQLLRAMAVAGFAAANIMLLSVSIWAGHAQGMGEATRTLLHWFSALIALPAIAYTGRPFFVSAGQALRHRRTNMDVPISVGVMLAAAMSLAETVRGGEHAYFDSVVMLLFFLLVGRSVPAGEVRPGMLVLASAGQRVGVDGRVLSGTSEVDTSLITGEALPRPVQAGDQVFAGTLNIGAPLRIELTAIGERTLLAEIVRLMELAEQRRARFVVLADRVARLYAPAVPGLALATFLAWTLLFGAAWHTALLYAFAVLIITCPCALGLAVPAVQVIASGRLLHRGVLLKSATALERLAQVDTVAFDKTGTLTLGRATLDPSQLRTRPHSALRPRSRGPAATPSPGHSALPVPVCRSRTASRKCRASACAAARAKVRCGSAAAHSAASGTMITRSAASCGWRGRGTRRCASAFTDEVRADAAAVVQALKERGLELELLSGDRTPVVAGVAEALGIERWRGGCTPADKTARLEQLARAGRRVLMVGDGLNDAPALAAAHVSLSPSSAVDISQNAADAVFQGERLGPLLETLVSQTGPSG